MSRIRDSSKSERAARSNIMLNHLIPPDVSSSPDNPLASRGSVAGISRRRFVIAAGLAAAGTYISPRRLPADDGVVGIIKNSAATGKITVQPLRGNISVLLGSGGNIAVLPGPDGKLLVDAGIAVSQGKITDALAGISSDPITRLVNTHWHFDHTDGNRWLHDAGAEIIAHETTRKRLLVRRRVQGWRFTFPSAPKGALPTVTFKKDLVLDVNGARIVLNYYEPAHTDCDIAVHFTEADVIHVGDTWWNGIYPFIDYSSGGSIDGSIEAAEANVARVTENTIVIPGHGAVGNKADLVEFRDMLVAIRDKVAALKETGKSLEQTVAAKPTSEFDDKWGRFVVTPAAFTELVYQGV
jgi:glyoxylase-like metal-dependent hydrolase (beta-lactamase superfamily II)